MAIIQIRTPPDGNDLSAAAVARFQAVLPQGLTPKEAIIQLLKFFVRQRELQIYQRQQSALQAGNIQTRAGELSNDPDVGGSDF